MKRPLYSLLALACAFTAPSSRAVAQTETATGIEVEKDLALLRRNLRSEKKKLIALNVPLTDTEATKFWPAYDAYALDMSKHYDDFYALIKDYAAHQKDTDGCPGHRHAQAVEHHPDRDRADARETHPAH
jgi:hypothetical protein